MGYSTCRKEGSQLHHSTSRMPPTLPFSHCVLILLSFILFLFLLSPELFHGVLHPFGHEIYILVVLVLVWLHGGQGRLELAVLWLVGERVLELPEAAEETCTPRPHLSLLLTQSKLHREPVHLTAATMVGNK